MGLWALCEASGVTHRASVFELQFNNHLILCTALLVFGSISITTCRMQDLLIIGLKKQNLGVVLLFLSAVFWGKSQQYE